MNTTTLQAPKPPHDNGRVLDAKALRAALGRFTTGVTVVTACAPDGRQAGVTANSFNSVSLDPPLVLWSLARKSGSLPVFEQSSHWAVHVLTHDQVQLSSHFARPNADKFDGIGYQRGVGGVPLLDGCAARFVCRTAHLYDGGDHVILVGEVVEFERNEGPALVYNDSGYAIATATEIQRVVSEERDHLANNELGFLLGSAFYYLFSNIRDAAGELGFTNTEAFVITALLQRGRRSRQEIEALLHYAGHVGGRLVLDDLEASGMLSAAETGNGTEFDLTGQGLDVARKMAEATHDITNRMDEILGPSGSIALRALLSRFVRDTAGERPVSWL